MVHKRRLLLAGVLTFAIPVMVSSAEEPNSSPPVATSQNNDAHSQTAPGQHAEGAKHIEWGYTGPTGPEHWTELSEGYTLCSSGQQESPVDLRGAVPAKLGKLKIDWKSIPLKVTNNGHTIQIETPPGGSLAMDNKTYALAQFHFHHPSEHLLGGRRFPLEVHFVHKSGDGTLGVLGVFIEEGKANPALQAILDNTPTQAGTTKEVDGRSLDLKAFLPRKDDFFRYEGSLTTPPCSEVVDWVVLNAPIQASTEQIKAFEKIYPMNARPLQALNRRFLLFSSK